MPLQATSGAASYDGFGGGAAAVIPYYIEDMFSCFLYTGNATARSIVNNIDISGNGGLVWTKSRSLTGSDHFFVDTNRGATKYLNSNSPAAQVSTSDITAFNSTGYTLNADVNGGFNNNGATFASWTFRKQPKFFDVVTYTGDGTNNRAIAHNLGSVPGCIVVKATSSGLPWAVKHRSLTASQYLVLNDTASATTTFDPWSTNPTSTVFYVNGVASSLANGNGVTYVAYLFAHDAGGFGLTGSDNVISCGSYVGTGAVGNAVTLGYEPQWLMVKNRTAADDWIIYDNMRGMPASATNTGNTKFLKPNLSNAEAGGNTIAPTATGFEINTGASVVNTTSDTYIYIAIRRGPMKVPTTGTSVYKAITYNGVNTAGQVISGAGFSPDLAITKSRNGTFPPTWMDRLRGGTGYLFSDSTAAEGNTAGYYIRSFDMDGVTYGTAYGDYTNLAYTYVAQFLKRAPSFMDEVCYTGTGSSMSITHNLGVGPELVIVKRRNSTSDWQVAAKINSTQYTVGASGNELALNSSGGGTTTYYTYATYFSSTAFQTGAFWTTPNINGGTYVAYLFATCAGVSKVGSYTGTATTLQIDCGFTAGARFVLIKRTDSTGDWYVWDTARGIVSGNDSYLLLNSTAAEVTNTDYIDTYSAGFEISSTAPAAINANGGSFIFFAVA